MHKKRWLYGSLAILIVLGLILGTGAFAYRRIPTVTNQLASQDDTTVLIMNPASASHYPADAAIPITALAASSQPVQALELWTDGSLFETSHPGADDDPNFFYETWHWMPLSTGEHILTVRAVNLDGSIGTSNLLRITADQAAGYVLRHTIQPGETLDSLTQSCDTNIDTIVSQNPGLDPAAPLPAGGQINIPCATLFAVSDSAGTGITPPLTQEPDSSPSSPPGNFEFMLSSLFFPASALTNAPGLTAGLNGCIGKLVVQDNSTDEQGFEIWRSGVSGFERIATLGPNTGATFTYQDVIQQSGQIQYVVSAFTTKGKSASNIVAVNVPNGACGDPNSPLVSFANGILTVPADLDVAYLYASLDGGPWQRLPSGEGFFSPTNGKVDLSQYMDQLLTAFPGTRLASLKVWGWSSGQLRDLGSLAIKIDHTELTFCNLDDPGQCTGDVGSTHWVTTGEVPSNALNSERTFRFFANTPGIKYVLVQVSAKPFGSTFQLESPYLVDAFAVQAEQGESAISGKFTLNFSYYQQPDGTSQNSEFILEKDIFQVAEPSLFDDQIIRKMQASGSGSKLEEGLPDPVYYVRVIPWDYDKPAGALSNPVDLTYKARQENSQFSLQTTFTPFKIVMGTSTPDYDLKIVGYSPEVNVNPDNFGCVVIKAIDEAVLRADLPNYYPLSGGISGQWKIDNAVSQYQALLASGEPICPSALPPKESPSFWDYLADFWTAFVDGWNLIKVSVVQMVVDGLNGLFDGDICDSDCSAVLMTGLNLAITYFTGIPPTLPTAHELLTQGFEYAVSVGLSEAGVSCDSLCTELVHQQAEELSNMLLATESQPGCRSSEAELYNKQALCLPAGLTLEPITGAVYSPPVVTLQASRIGSGYQVDTLGSDYSVLITSVARNDAVVGQSSYYIGPWWYMNDYQDVVSVEFPYTVSEPMEGILYPSVSLELPDTLTTGKQLTIPITLTTPVTSMEPYPDAYFYPSLLTQAWDVADAKGMGSVMTNSLYQTVHRESYKMLSSPGYSVTFTAVLLCYDKSAQGKVPCSEPVTRQFSADEILFLFAMMGAQP